MSAYDRDRSKDLVIPYGQTRPQRLNRLFSSISPPAVFRPADFLNPTQWGLAQKYDIDAQDETLVTAGLRATLDAAVEFIAGALGERSAVVDFGSAGYAVNDELFSDAALVTLYALAANTLKSHLWLRGAGIYGGTLIQAKDWLSATRVKPASTRLAGETVPSAMLRIEGRQTSWSIIVHGDGIRLSGEADIDTDPVGLWITNQNAAKFENMAVMEFAGGGFWLEGAFNSRYNDFQIDRCGWNPTEAGSLGARNGLTSSTITFDATAGVGTTDIVASEPVFEALHQTNNAWFFVQNAAGNGQYLQGQITSVVDSTHATINVQATSNQTGVKGSFGIIRGTIASVATDADAKTLVLSNTIEATNLVGRYIHIPKAGSTSAANAADQHDLFSTRIAAYDNGTRTITMEHPAEVTVTGAPIIFAPSQFVGRTQDSEWNNRSDDIIFMNWRVEHAFDGERGGSVSLIAQDLHDITFFGCKWHGDSPGFANFGANAIAAVIDNNPVLSFINCIFEWGGNLPDHGKIWVMGEQNLLHFSRCFVGEFQEGSKTAFLKVDPKLASGSFANNTQIDWGIINDNTVWPVHDQVDVRLGTNGLASMVRLLHPQSQTNANSRSRWATQYTNILDVLTRIELGDDNDTSITRVSAGLIAVEGGNVPLENRANTFTALQTITRAGNPLTLTNTTDAGANQGMIIESARSGAAVNFDSVHATWRVKNSAGNQVEVARLLAQATNVTASAENGRMAVTVIVAGVLTTAWIFAPTAITPGTNDGGSIGASGNAVSDYFGATGHVFNLGAGNVTITHSAGLWTMAGGGFVLAAGTTSLGPLRFQSGTNLTTAATGTVEYDGRVFYMTSVASTRQVVLTKQFITTQVVTALSNSSTAAQNVFASANDVMSLAANTAYRFKLRFFINTGSTTHTTALGLAVSSAVTNIGYWASLWSTTAGTISTTAPSVLDVTATTATVLNATSTATRTTIEAEGIIRTNGATTLTPQITFSAGPGGTCEVAVNSFFEIWPIGSDTVVGVGNLA